MNIFRFITAFVLCIWLSAGAMGQQKTAITQQDYQNQQIEMADEWRANGKIYVVVATVATLLAGMFGYLIVIDRKVSKLEKQ